MWSGGRHHFNNSRPLHVGSTLRHAFPEQVKATLDAVADSDVILGDVNTRFNGSVAQRGPPGPSPRLEFFRQWMDANPIGHVMPSCDKTSFAGSPCEAMFNLDHCFVRDSLRTHALLLPSTK